MTDTAEAAPALMEIFNRARLEHIAGALSGIDPQFSQERFLAAASENLDALSIMQRLRQIAVTLDTVMTGSYASKLERLRALAPHINHGFASITLPEFVALYGQDDFDLSMDALKYFTAFGSSEFAIRHFLQRDMERTLAVMQGWAEDDNEHVRRLASEGSRPRLPWSFQLRPLMLDPSPTAPILEALKADPSLYVRKSVANHLNDITKDNPDLALARVRVWNLGDARTVWIVRHALRSLIKKGDPRALALIGAGEKALVRIDGFSVTPPALMLGERLQVTAKLSSLAPAPQKLVIDYAVHYVKKAGGTSRKVFKWKELSLAPKEVLDISISQVIRDFTTRKHYPGFHRIDLMVNGETMAESGFELLP